MKKEGFCLAISFLILVVGCQMEQKTDITSSAIDVVKYSCEDSDNGINQFEAGHIKGTYQGEEFKMEDECFDYLLVEYYCGGNNPNNMKIDCEKGCAEGKCS